MENNNKKKKYYQYYKNNQRNNYYNHYNKYYYKKKKKANNNINNEIVNNNQSNINSQILNINENVDYNEYEGLLKKKVLINDEIIENNNSNNYINNSNYINNNYNSNEENNYNSIDLDSILVRKDSVNLDENNDINSEINVIDNNINNNDNNSIINNIDNIDSIDNINTVNNQNQEIIPSYVMEEKEENIDSEKSYIIRTKFGYALGFFILVFALFGSTYAFFNYYKEDTRQADIAAGEVYARIEENNLNLNLTSQYPRTNAEARARTDNYIDFTLVGKNTSLTKVLGYSFSLTNGVNINGKTRMNSDYILFDLAELDSNNNETLLLSGVTLTAFNSANISNLYIPTNQTSEFEKKYRVRAWISESVTISDDESENATYTQSEYANLFANFKVHINSVDKVLNTGE